MILFHLLFIVFQKISLCDGSARRTCRFYVRTFYEIFSPCILFLLLAMDQIYKRAKRPSFVSNHGPSLFGNNSRSRSGNGNYPSSSSAQDETNNKVQTHRSIKNRIRAINRLLAKPVRRLSFKCVYDG